MERSSSSRLGGTNIEMVSTPAGTAQLCHSIPYIVALVVALVVIGPATAQNGQGQEIKNEDGSLFMEEVAQPRKNKPKPATPALDYSSLGVPVDQSGRIVPLIQPGAGRVLQNFSRTEIEYTPPTMYVPYYTFAGPYGYAPASTPWGTYLNPIYRPQYSGALAVPLGMPGYFSSSSDNPAGTQLNYQMSGQSWAAPGASIWNPGWRSPWGGTFWLPPVRQFQSQGSIRSFFPQNMSQ